MTIHNCFKNYRLLITAIPIWLSFNLRNSALLTLIPIQAELAPGSLYNCKPHYNHICLFCHLTPLLATHYKCMPHDKYKHFYSQVSGVSFTRCLLYLLEYIARICMISFWWILTLSSSLKLAELDEAWCCIIGITV